MEILTFFLVFLLFSSANGDLEGDRTALRAFKNAVGGRMRWDSNSSVCKWRGIKCSNARVYFLSLPAAVLSGTIPAFTLGNLTHLRILRLRLNSLQGPLPADLANCKQLRSLYLQDNFFSGPLPNFSDWPNLMRLNLAHNNFTGSLPDSLKDLKRLGTLLIENNSLTGPLPPLNLPNLTQFNVSYNQFEGPVPESLKHFSADSFRGNNLCDSPLTPCINNSSGGKGNDNGGSNNSSGGKGNDKGRRVGIIVAIVVGSVVLVGLVLGILVKRRDGEKSKKKGPKYSDGSKTIDESFTKEEYSISVQEPEKRKANLVFFAREKEKEEAEFSLEDLLRASAELLGKGSVGTAYRAVLEMGVTVVVKRLKDVGIGQRDFAHQIQIMGKIKHKNLVPLRAYYYSSEEKLLVYDYMPRGSLSALLHGNRETGRLTLDWRARVNIALGAAMGIEYLHKQSSKICHGNIKSSNILVTNNYDGCVGDFGLVQMVSKTTAATNTTTLGNKSLGYRAPEVIEIHKVSQKADVYSFGVLILELLTGKAATQASLSDDGVDLPRWVQSVVQEEWTSEVFDMDLIKQHGDSMDEKGMLQLLQVAMQCVALYPDQRPTMSQVVKMIQDLSPTSPKQELKSPE